MDKEQLLELRNKIMQSTQEIALRGDGSPMERFQVLMNLVRGGNVSFDVLAKTYELAQSVEGDDEKLSALLDILYEVDAKLGESNSEVQQQEPAPESHESTDFNEHHHE